LGILNLEDRVVHAALKQVLEPILEPAFATHSYGFRPGRCVPGALQSALNMLNGSHAHALPYQFVCKLDVADCFDTIDHQILKHRLVQILGDDDALELLARLLAVCGTAAGWLWWRRAVGLAQGSGLSPLLCNFYLHPLDEQLALESQRTGGGTVMLRYADDLLILARDRKLARRSVRLAQQALGAIRQTLKPSKQEIQPATAGTTWLGLEIRPRRDTGKDRVEFAYYVPDDKLQRMLERIDEMTVPPSTRIDPAAFDLGRWLVSINEQLRDWWQAYRFAANAPVVFRQVDRHAFERVGALLRTVMGLPMRSLYGDYRAWLPRGFQTWQINGTRLSVLSSLAPRCPTRLIRRPPWMCRKLAK
jgi:hypothetical protein